MYPAARFVFVALAGAPVVLLAAMVSPPLWLFGVAWIGLVIALFFLDAVLATRPSDISVHIQAPSTVGVGRAESISVEVHCITNLPRNLQLAIDTDARLRTAPKIVECTPNEGSAIAHFSMLPIRRGETAIEAVWVRWRGPMGLTWRQRIHSERRIVAVVPDIAGVKEQVVPLFQREAAAGGLRLRIRPGQGTEFNALKEFQSGMERRTIDWKQSARHRKLLAREFKAEENLHVVFAIDTGRLMSEPLAGLPKIDRAIQALLLLAFAALRLGDRVGIFAFDERPRLSSGTIGGVNAFAVLQRLAARLDYSTAETNFMLGLTQLSAETLHRSIIVVFTDFSDTIGAELMVENLQLLLKRHIVVFVVFRDEELETLRRASPAAPADVSRAVLADAMLREREAVTARLKRIGVDVVEAPLERIGLRLVETYLVLKHGASGA